METILTKENFDEIVLGSAEPILVDFWASWCGPCMMLSPIVEELRTDFLFFVNDSLFNKLYFCQLYFPLYCFDSNMIFISCRN